MKITADWYAPAKQIDLTGCSRIVFGDGEDRIRITVRDGRITVNGDRILSTIHDAANQFAVVLADVDLTVR
jgi:hypothetical protein